MRVLIVESDRALGLFLQKGLQLEGHETCWIREGTAALEQCESRTPEVLIFGADMREESSFLLLASLRTAVPHAPMLVLTADCGVDNRIRCFDMGADDCLFKPFSFHELVARCRAILRRLAVRNELVLRVGRLEIDILRRTVRCDGKQLELTGKEFGLLECLLRRNGSCCSREELLREVWQVGLEASTSVVDVYVNYLRKKITSVLPQTSQENLIETVRGSGYRINPAAYGIKRERESVAPKLALGA